MRPQRMLGLKLARCPPWELREDLPSVYLKSCQVTLMACHEQELTQQGDRVPQRLRWVEFRLLWRLLLPIPKAAEVPLKCDFHQ
jgi:hypothetical protein